jgi:guanosine-3',5'-bis(diphosphate) 3'-pyrophosphohydrolase
MPQIETIFNTQKFTKKDRDLIAQAYDFAKIAHQGQLRKSGEPYFVHVFTTAKNLAEIGMDSTIIAAGFLHDVLEDTEVKEDEMRQIFGDEITDLVLSVTKLGTVKYTGIQRNVENLRKFFVSIADDMRVIVIKLADRLHNIETLEHVRPDKQKRIALETLEVYAPLADRLSMGKLKGRLEDAAFPYAYPQEYEKIKILRESRTDAAMPELLKVEKNLKKIFNDYNLNNIQIDHREKHLYSLWKKLEKYEMDITHVYDIIAMRVIVKNIEECYLTLGLIHGTYKPLPGRIKDYIALPKPNGYRSIHTTIITDTGSIIEIQIRTLEMHQEAEYGLAAHFAYKENINGNHERYAWIKELRDAQQDETNIENFFKNLKTDFFHDRVFAFTPKGEIINLPEGGSVLDFAFNVHSAIGMHAEAGEVNGKYTKLDHKLKNGDVVKIIVNKKINPSSKWLSFVKSSIARKHIEKYLKQNSLLSRLLSFNQK